MIVIAESDKLGAVIPQPVDASERLADRSSHAREQHTTHDGERMEARWRPNGDECCSQALWV